MAKAETFLLRLPHLVLQHTWRRGFAAVIGDPSGASHRGEAGTAGGDRRWCCGSRGRSGPAPVGSESPDLGCLSVSQCVHVASGFAQFLQVSYLPAESDRPSTKRTPTRQGQGEKGCLAKKILLIDVWVHFKRKRTHGPWVPLTATRRTGERTPSGAERPRAERPGGASG